MKLGKFFVALLALFVAVGAVPFSRLPVYANPEVRVQIAGRFVDFEGQPPIIQDGRVLVPVRGVFTLMGFEPHWNPATYTATLYDGTTTIILPIGHPTFTVNGTTIWPDVPQQSIGGRILIPLRAVSDAIGGMPPEWNAANLIATIHPPPELMERVMVNLGLTPPTPTPTPTPPPAVPPSITTETLENGTTGSAFSQQLAATGTVPIYWSVQSGSLPPGITLNAGNGIISGTPTQTGSFSFVIRAQNPEGYDMVALTIVIEDGRDAPFLGTQSSITLPNRRLNNTEMQQWITEYMANNGANPFEVEVIRLVNLERTAQGLASLTMCHTLMLASRFYAQTMANLNTGLGNEYGPYGGSAGTADAFGDTVQIVRLMNSSGGIWTAQAIVSGWMAHATHRSNILNPYLTRIGMGSQLGGVNEIYHHLMLGGGTATPVPGAAGTHSLTFEANGGTGAMLPQTFNHGVAQAIRANAFVRAGHTFQGWSTTATGAVQYTNQQSITLTTSRTLFAVWTVATAPVITTTALPNVRVAQAYDQTLVATGATPITWSVTGALPGGLTLDPYYGTITGTAVIPGTFTFTIRAQNALGETSRSFTIVVEPAQTVNVPNVVGMSYFAATAALEAYGFTVIVRDRYIDANGVDTVREQIPAANTAQHYNTAVTIFVNRGVGSVASIAIRNIPRISYTVGDTFDPRGLDITVTWASGRVSVVSDGFILTTDGMNPMTIATGAAPTLAWIFQTMGQRTVTVTYEERSATFVVDIAPRGI